MVPTELFVLVLPNGGVEEEEGDGFRSDGVVVKELEEGRFPSSFSFWSSFSLLLFTVRGVVVSVEVGTDAGASEESLSSDAVAVGAPIGAVEEDCCDDDACCGGSALCCRCGSACVSADTGSASVRKAEAKRFESRIWGDVVNIFECLIIFCARLKFYFLRVCAFFYVRSERGVNNI